MSNFSLQFPIWTIFIPVLTGLLFAAILYYKDKRFEEKSRNFQLMLAAFRFLAVSVIVFLLLGPYFSSMKEERSKPVVLLAQDVSESVLFGSKNDSSVVINALKDLQKDLSKKYDVELVHFGESVAPDISNAFNHKITNYSNLLQYIDQQYQGRMLSSVILFSDGIYNEGENPVYAQTLKQAAFYSIAMGDTTKKSDVALKNVLYNDLAFMGDKLNIQFNMTAYKLEGKQTEVTILEIVDGKTKLLDKKPINIKSDDFFFSDDFILDADKPGTRHFRISARSVPNEMTLANNTKDIYIDVIDSRIHVVILANAPHPDLSAIKQSLESLKNYKISIKMAGSEGIPQNTDLVILHNLPSVKNPVNDVFQTITQKKIPHLFIVGQQTDLNTFNKSQDLIRISSSLKSFNESQASLNKQFFGFELDPETAKSVELFPPLLSPFGTIEAAPHAQTLLFQNISKVRTSYPLLSFGDQNGLKNGVLMGEGIWKWRLFDFAQNGQQNSIHQIIGKTAQLIATKADTRKWRVESFKTVYNENEHIRFRANLYNDNNEPVNSPDAFMYIKNVKGEVFEFVFSRSENAYSLDASFLPPGEYTYRATVQLGGKDHTDSGKFAVKEIQLETFDLVARHDLLRQMAALSGGNVFSLKQVESLKSQLLDAEVKPVVYAQRKTSPLINFKWLFFLILIWLSIEWFLRRYFGSY
ncbi:MAG TPA: hypothetical protein DCX89_00060 [Saprospirales bacterium]|nr:hypothetical protein [Saprospirales bacterium]HAY70259.1 hypothetical protein [Saprospirales bacterium]HRQ29492.1 hypothetical protein [Saprospiraceae bacterium]